MWVPGSRYLKASATEEASNSLAIAMGLIRPFSRYSRVSVIILVSC
jgi:hypothetical protein